MHAVKLYSDIEPALISVEIKLSVGLSFCVLNSESKMGVLILFCEEQFHVLFLIRSIVLTVVLTIVPCLCKKVLRFLFFLVIASILSLYPGNFPYSSSEREYSHQPDRKRNCLCDH